MSVILRNRSNGNLSFEVEHYRSTATLTLSPSGSLAPLHVTLRTRPPHNEIDLSAVCGVDDASAMAIAGSSPQVVTLERRGMLAVIERGRAVTPVPKVVLAPPRALEPEFLDVVEEPSAAAEPDPEQVFETFDEATDALMPPQTVSEEDMQAIMAVPGTVTIDLVTAGSTRAADVLVDADAAEEAEDEDAETAEEAGDKPRRRYPEGEPSGTWKVRELKAYADARGIAVPPNSSKRVYLRLIREASA